MVVRATMAPLISHIRLMINDPSGVNQQFSDSDIQTRLDANRDDIRYESLRIAPSIVNLGSTNNQAQTVFADFYSDYGWWESDVVLQANYGGAAWVVVTPVSSELLLDQAHFAFEANVFTAGTVPGQLPPVFATGKVYDIYATASDLLEFWSARWLLNYDFSSDGASFHRSQASAGLMKLAALYRRRAKPRTMSMERTDIADATTLERSPLLSSAIDSMSMESR